MKRGTQFGSPCARGLTLIELVVVLAIVGLLAGVAAPGFASFMAGQRVGSLAHDLTADLLFARSEALKRNTTVTVTPVGGSWAEGWSVAGGGNDLLRRQASRSSVSFGGAPVAITFGSQGRVSAPAANVRITVSDSGNPFTRRCVELDLSGRARNKREACSA